MKPVVLSRVPRAGLANKLLVWSHALVFSRKNDYPLYENDWFHISIGPYIRRERSKRLYYNFLKKSKYLPFRYRFLKRCLVPKSNWMNIKEHHSVVYEFHEVPHHTTYFELIKEYRKEIVEEFLKKVNPKILNMANSFNAPDFAIHIRLGDFKSMPWHSWDWDYYSKLIHDLQDIVGRKLNVMVFSDGKNSEIKLLEMMDSVSVFSSGNDLVDMLVMSRSKIIHTFPGSTFSLWAGFISENILLHKADHQIRPASVSNFEGAPYLSAGLIKEKLMGQVSNSINQL